MYEGKPYRSLIGGVCLIALLFAMVPLGGCGRPRDNKNLNMMFPGPRPDWSPQRVLPHVDQIAILTNERRWGQISAGRRDDAVVIYSLRASTNYHKGKPTRTPDMRIVVYWANGRRADWINDRPVYQYVSATGELGRGDDWCQAPKDFRKWALGCKHDLLNGRSHSAAAGAAPRRQ